jgi:hypothetical protein
VGNKSINRNIGTFVEQMVNKNGMRLIDFAVYNNLRIMNTFTTIKISTNIPGQLGIPNQ